MKRLKKVLQGVKGAKRAYYYNRLSSDKVSELKVSYVQKKSFLWLPLMPLDAMQPGDLNLGQTVDKVKTRCIYRVKP